MLFETAVIVLLGRFDTALLLLEMVSTQVRFSHRTEMAL